MNHLLGPRQSVQVAVDRDAAKQWYTNTSRLPNSFVNVPIGRPLCSRLDNKIIGQTTAGFKISNIFG